MGLDCTAYKNVTIIDNPDLDEEGYPVHDHHVMIYVNEHFSEQADGLQDSSIYSYEDEYGWRAGSYGGYNGWRQRLADLGGYSADRLHAGEEIDAERTEEGFLPFEHLVNFSDCDGTLGPVTCARLLKDFKTFESKAQTIMDTYDYTRYKEWTEALEMASQNGFIVFH